ncbi:MAG: serine/threonine-protein kinase [Reyranellaceae bacterium]
MSVEPHPTTIGRYVVEGLLGAGAMGQIYRARDPDIKRTVAIKLISTRLMSGADREDYIKRFRREAEAAARCAHPNIITIYDFALHDGEPFLAMEFVDGLSLRQVLDASPVMAVPEALGIMLQVLDALASTHEQGVIHQDIKPANIMLTSGKRVKVGDFGISRFANVEATIDASVAGTPAYMSPEQCRGEEVDGRSDLFSVGTTLFEMVAGKRAFAGRNVTEISHQIRNGRLPQLPAEVRAAVPRLQTVLERATAKQPEDRYSTASAMADALRHVLAVSAEGTADETRIERAPTPRPVRSAAVPPAHQIEAETLQLLEDRLKVYLGPIARIMVRAAASKSRSLDELCAELLLAVRDGAERERFRREVEPLMRTSLGTPLQDSVVERSGATGSQLPERELERAQAALARYTGPIARILVRQEAANASTIDALWDGLARHIDSPAERTDFLRLRAK